MSASSPAAEPSDSLHPSAGVFAADGRVHRLAVRVYYEDTDFSGVVYHARYLQFLERGRSDFLRTAGVRHNELLAADAPIVFAVRRMAIDFAAAARIDDALIVETRFGPLKGARLVIAQAIRRAGHVILTADVEAVCLTPEGRPTRAPQALLAALAPHVGPLDGV